MPLLVFTVPCVHKEFEAVCLFPKVFAFVFEDSADAVDEGVGSIPPSLTAEPRSNAADSLGRETLADNRSRSVGLNIVWLVVQKSTSRSRRRARRSFFPRHLSTGF